MMDCQACSDCDKPGIMFQQRMFPPHLSEGRHHSLTLFLEVNVCAETLDMDWFSLVGYRQTSSNIMPAAKLWNKLPVFFPLVWSTA